MNNYKSQGQTFEQARVNLEDGIFVEDPFFKEHVENIQKQREVALGFDQVDTDKVIDVSGSLAKISDLEDNVGKPSLVWFDEVNNIIDGDELYVQWLKRREGKPFDHVFNNEGDNFTLFDDEAEIKDADALFEMIEGSSPTGRFKRPSLPDIHSLPRPDIQISGEDPALKPRKHPMIFKITDLVDDEEEMERLRKTLHRNRKTEILFGWPAPPMFIESIPDANIVARACTDLMSQLTSLAKEYKVEIYFGTKPALKTALYILMYGGKKKDLDMSQLDEISVEKAIEMYESKLRKVAIVGGGVLGFGKMAKLLADHYSSETVCVDSLDTWDLNDFFAISKVDKPSRDWEQNKLRRGKGHNKFKRKGKK